MNQTFFTELNNDAITGVAYKNVNLKKVIVSYFANTGNSTIADLSRELNLSVPKVTNLVNELIEDGLVQDHGKIDSTGGRKPNHYGLVPDSGFFMGVDVKQHFVTLGFSDLQKNLVHLSENIPYHLSNDRHSLEELCRIITAFIQSLPVAKEKILGVGINLSGRVNSATGYSYSFFYFEAAFFTAVAQNFVVE